VIVRNATEADLDRLAGIWHQGWHESHAQLVPMELTGFAPCQTFATDWVKRLPICEWSDHRERPSASTC
jgi:hypothetical protein